MIGQLTKKGVHKRKFVYSSNTDSSHNWTHILRADKEHRLKIVEGFNKALEAKEFILYDNGSKATRLYDDTKKYKFDCSKLTKKTYANCCDFASVLCRYAGLKTPRKCNSRTLPEKWKDKGFKIIKYRKGMKLYKGDVLVSTIHPHTALIV